MVAEPVRPVVKETSEAVIPAPLSSVTELQSNTVRFHLDALTSQGLVERTLDAPSGRGRPRTVSAARPGMNRAGRRQYRLLAEILLGRLASTDGEAGAEDAARAWADARPFTCTTSPSRQPR
jgi:predicted ArsR family transcriptional regulator